MILLFNVIYKFIFQPSYHVFTQEKRIKIYQSYFGVFIADTDNYSCSSEPYFTMMLLQMTRLMYVQYVSVSDDASQDSS